MLSVHVQRRLLHIRCVVLTNGESLSAFNQFEQVLMLVNEDTFIRLNKQNNLYANYAAIKGIEKDGEKEWIRACPYF